MNNTGITNSTTNFTHGYTITEASIDITITIMHYLLVVFRCDIIVVF